LSSSLLIPTSPANACTPIHPSQSYGASPAICTPITELRSVTCHMHTHHRATERHLPYAHPSQSYGASSAICTPITELRSVICRMESHSVICHLTQVNVPHLNPSRTGRYLTYLPRRDGRLSWPWWLVIYRDGLPVRRQSPIQLVTIDSNLRGLTN